MITNVSIKSSVTEDVVVRSIGGVIRSKTISRSNSKKINVRKK